MIRRDTEGLFYLIRQHDHALLSDQLARAIGNGLFAPPMPFDAVVQGIGQHDAGWTELDERPSVDAHGRPVHVFEGDIAGNLQAWQRSADILAGKNPYGGLLVSLHGMHLGRAAMAHHAEPRQRFLLNRFLHAEAERQEVLRRKLGMSTQIPLSGGLAGEGISPEEDLLAVNFRLLQFLDAVSLVLCFDRVIFPKLEPVYPRVGEASVTVRIARDEHGAVRLDPWPFAAERIELTVPAIAVQAKAYRDAQELHQAMQHGEAKSLGLCLRPWSA